MANAAAIGRLPRVGRGPRSALLLRMASDERLVALVRGGSEAAFEALYDRHHRGILAFCRHMLSSADEAEDAVQHTFMAAYRHLVSRAGEIQLRPWLYAIARNRCLSMLRVRRERPLDEHYEPATENLSAEAQRRQDVRELLADVAALPEDQRAALVLAELGAVSHEEIAMVLEVPRQRVKALVFQARTSLVASRTARATPCAEIREQLANLRGGALRRTTLHRHLRECPGCREFREEVALQRKTLAVALPVIPTLGLKEAALGAALGSASAGGGAAAATGGALAAKALVTVALVGGGASAGVEVTRHAALEPEPVQRSAAPAERARAAAGAVAGERAVSAPVAHRPIAPRRAAGHAEEAARGTTKGHADAKHAAPVLPTREHAARDHEKAHLAPPGRVKPEHAGRGRVKPEHAASGPDTRATHPERARTKPTRAKAVPPGQAKRIQPAQPPAVPKAKAHPPSKVKAAEPIAVPIATPVAEPAPKSRGKP